MAQNNVQPSGGSMEIDRTLRDGASYRLVAEPGAVTAISVHDPHGDIAVIAIERADVRQLIDDLTQVAGLQPTMPVLGLAGALANSARILFARIEVLERTEPEAAAMIRRTIMSHMRSSTTMMAVAL